MTLKNCFSGSEWQAIINSPNSLVSFYRYWTRKEAVLKAYGSGLNIDPIEVQILSDVEAYFQQTQFSFKEITIDDCYVCTLCSSRHNIQISRISVLTMKELVASEL